MSDDVEFEVETPKSPETSALAQREGADFAAVSQAPNTACIPLWHGGYITFNPDSSIPVLR